MHYPLPSELSSRGLIALLISIVCDKTYQIQYGLKMNLRNLTKTIQINLTMLIYSLLAY